MKPGWAVVAVMMTLFAALGACAPAAAPPQYDDYRATLLAFVDARGRVDYAGLKEQRGDLDDFVTYLERLDPKLYDRWSEKDKMALWINAYNALTLRTIIDNYPIVPAVPNGAYPYNSIRQLKDAWDFKRVNVMGQSITLGYIKTKILRRDFHDPRVHMALGEAAISSPVLRNEPYEGAKLDAQLDDQVRRFLSDPNQFHVDRDSGEVRISEVFHQYADDFAPLGGFASRYVSAEDRAFLAANQYRLSYAPYDWTLNEQPR